jgi:hypothetical protein
MSNDDTQLQKARTLIHKTHTLQLTFINASKPIPRDKLTYLILLEIPLFYNLLQRINTGTSSLGTWIRNTHHVSAPVMTAARVTPFVGIIFQVLDFTQIPLLYLTSWALREKPPVTLRNNIRWLYATAIFALFLAALAIPGAAPVIAICSASLAVLGTMTALGHLFREYYKDKNKLEGIIEKIHEGSAGRIQKYTLELEIACRSPIKNNTLIDKLISKIELLHKECEKDAEDIKTLYQKASVLEKKLKIETDVVDNSMKIALASLALASSVVALFFPVAALGIMIVAASAGTVYALTRLVSPHFLSPKTNPYNKPVPLQKQTGTMETSTEKLFHKFHVQNKNIAPNRPQVKNSNPVIEKKSSVEEEQQPETRATHSRNFK